MHKDRINHKRDHLGPITAVSAAPAEAVQFYLVPICKLITASAKQAAFSPVLLNADRCPKEVSLDFGGARSTEDSLSGQAHM